MSLRRQLQLAEVAIQVTQYGLVPGVLGGDARLPTEAHHLPSGTSRGRAAEDAVWSGEPSRVVVELVGVRETATAHVVSRRSALVGSCVRIPK